MQINPEFLPQADRQDRIVALAEADLLLKEVAEFLQVREFSVPPQLYHRFFARS